MKSNTATIATSVTALLNVVLCRESWSLKQTPAGVEISGTTGSGREISATVRGVRLPRGVTRILGGVLGWDCDTEAHAEEARRVEAARWLCRSFREAPVTVTLEWEADRSPYSSAFGVEVMAALGFGPAKDLLDRIESHYWNHPLCEAEMEHFADLFAPLPEGDADGDDAPFFAPMWAA